MNLRYYLKIIDLDMPNDNVIVNEYSSDIKDIENALIDHSEELGEMISGRCGDE